jgi:hypothetical protein
MRIDKYDFENTAKAVFVMNPSAQTRYDDWQDLMSFMESMAYQYMTNTTSFSTSGFQLTSYPSADGCDICVRASVCAYTALRYIESVQKT